MALKMALPMAAARRDRRRLADADDAALRHVVHVDDDLRHVLDAAELVELHVGVDLPAGVRGP